MKFSMTGQEKVDLLIQVTALKFGFSTFSLHFNQLIKKLKSDLHTPESSYI
jgi:hypothetical protein